MRAKKKGKTIITKHGWWLSACQCQNDDDLWRTDFQPTITINVKNRGKLFSD